MRKLVILFSLVVSISSNAYEYEGQLVEPHLFEELFSSNQKSNWASSANVCQARTVCPNGMPIWCRVFGYQHVSNGRLNSSCNWFVLPGRAVHCRGYQEVMTPYGYQWSWVDFPVRCF